MSGRVGERTRQGVGVSVPRIDGVPKAKGQFAYGSDLWADEMLWGHTLRSPHPSARIRSRRKARRPQWKSPIGVPKKVRPRKLSTGLPRYL